MGLEKVYCSVHGRCSKCELYIKGYCSGALDWNWRDCPQRNPRSQDPRIVEVIKKVKEGTSENEIQKQ